MCKYSWHNYGDFKMVKFLFDLSIQNFVVSPVNGATKHREVIAQIKKGHFNKHWFQIKEMSPVNLWLMQKKFSLMKFALTALNSFQVVYLQLHVKFNQTCLSHYFFNLRDHKYSFDPLKFLFEKLLPFWSIFLTKIFTELSLIWNGQKLHCRKLQVTW